MEKAMAPHSSTLAWQIPWREEPGRLQSMGVARSRTGLSDFTFTFHFHALEKEMATHSSVLACRIPGTVEPGGLPSLGSHRVGHDWSDLAAAKAGNSQVHMWIFFYIYEYFSIYIYICMYFTIILCYSWQTVQRLSDWLKVCNEWWILELRL